MRLEFNILWVDDQPKRVESFQVKIYRSLRKEGFRLETLFAKSVAEANKYLSSDVYGDHIDLVLMDYDLGGGPMGDEGLEMVREHYRYKDIVFYSADAEALQKTVAAKNIQGIFCSNRDDLPDTVDEVFHVLVKKVVDIEHSRGIVMGATSDIDNLVNECLFNTFEKSNKSAREYSLNLVVKRLEEIRQRVEERVKIASNVGHVGELTSHHDIYTSQDRLVLLQKMLSTKSNLKDQCDAIGKYIKDTLPKRNNLAHLHIHKNGFSRKLKDKSGKELSSEDMRSLRQELLEFQEMCEVLTGELK